MTGRGNLSLDSGTPAGRVLRGIPASPGVAIGRIRVVDDPGPTVEERAIPPDRIEEEVSQFRAAITEVVAEITDVRDAMKSGLGEEGASIFDAQLMILHDPVAVDATVEDISREGKNAEYVFWRNVLRVLQHFDSMRGGMFKDRAADIRDVKRRVIRRLTGEGSKRERALSSGESIVAVGELTPSDTVALSQGAVLGVATERGGATSHAAIMARAHRLPAVMGVHHLLDYVGEGTEVILDGWAGTVVLDPTPEERRRYALVQDHYLELVQRLELMRELPSITQDGREVHLHANIEMPLEVEDVDRNGANGVGLFRTEFFLMTRSRLPSEDEQFEAYRRAVETLAPKPVVFRTMDLGGDKFASYIGADRERNPFLGLRGIRFLLGHEDVFRDQLRAILRASAFGPARVLLPMITTLEELRMTRRHLDEVMAELRAKNVPHDSHVPLGVMIETPAAVFMADHLAKECDFFSVGSNDLTQYTLAVDRTNERLGYLFNPFHPSVLRAVRGAVHAAHREGCWVTLCGEMAGDTLATALLVGLGIDDLSMSPALVPEVKQMIRSITYDEAHGIATRAIRLSTASEVEQLLRDFMKERFPELSEVKGW